MAKEILNKTKGVIASTAKTAVKNPVKTMYLLLGLGALVIGYKTYTFFFPKEKTTNYNPRLLAEATMNDDVINSKIELIVYYINNSDLLLFGTQASNILSLIYDMGYPNFVKLNKLFGARNYDDVFGLVVKNNIASNLVYRKLDLQTILKIEFANESEENRKDLEDIYTYINK